MGYPYLHKKHHPSVFVRLLSRMLRTATKGYRNLKREYNAALDDIKIKHHSTLRKQQIIHVKLIELKNVIQKKMWKDVKGTHEMLSKMLEEINESKRLKRLASISADKAAASALKAASRSSTLFNILKVSTCLINELKDEINGKMKLIEDLRFKVYEYKVIIECMDCEYEERCIEHRTQISSM